MAGEKKTSLSNNDNYNSVFESSKELDKYGVWVKSDPQAFSLMDSETQEPSVIPLTQDKDLQDISDDNLDNFVDILDIEEPLKEAPLGGSEKTYDAVQKTGDLKTEIPAADQEDFIPGVYLDPIPAKNSSPGDDPSLSLAFKEPAFNAENLQGKPAQDSDAVSDISIQLLTKIFEELSSIKQEITALKEAVIRTIPEEKPFETTVPVPAAPEEPEKIVLAGDELDDILNNADFIDDIRDTGKDIFDQAASPVLMPPGISEKEVLADTEELQWLMKEGDKPLAAGASGSAVLGEMSAAPIKERLQGKPGMEELSGKNRSPSEDAKSNALLIDDLLIENGSIKDIPIELDMDENEEDEQERLDLDSLNLGEPEDTSEVPLDMSDIGLAGEISFDDEPLDNILFSDEYLDISDEELDKIEQKVLQEFADASLTREEPSVTEREEIEKKYPAKDLEEEDKKKINNSRGIKDEMYASGAGLPNVKKELKTVLSSMDQLLESLPDNKIAEFAESEHFDTYRKLFKELGLA
ncbi:MAG: hypothetical protein LBD55_02780 [Treponema sp.]|jgi:hypothetical protein|nr:hypothetical protein [Treponema sp.]